MTTRVGIVGILAGVLGAIVANILTEFQVSDLVIFIVLTLIYFCSTLVALFYSRSRNSSRSESLGGLCGGISAAMIYFFWGASKSAITVQTLDLSNLINSTLHMFDSLVFWGWAIGSLGGFCQYWLVRKKKEEIDLSDPQMGMNAAISAVAATLFNLILTILFYTSLGEISQRPELSRQPALYASILLFVAQMSLTLVLPHEAKMAQHRSGLDEVKMAAFVSIASAPALTAVLYWLSPITLRSLWGGVYLLFSWVLSLASVWILFKKILPRRKALPAPQSKEGKEKALLFGSIGASHPGRLVTLCIGCGIVIALPMCITLISVGLNLAAAGYLGSTSFTKMLAQSRLNLTLWQFLLNSGLMLAFAALLSAIYLFYLFLGRKFGSISEQ